MFLGVHQWLCLHCCCIPESGQGGFCRSTCHPAKAGILWGTLSRDCPPGSMLSFWNVLELIFFNDMFSMIHRELNMYFYSRALECVKHADSIWGWFWKIFRQVELGGVMRDAAFAIVARRVVPSFIQWEIYLFLAQKRFWKRVIMCVCEQEPQSKIQGWSTLTELATLLLFNRIEIAMWLNWSGKLDAFPFVHLKALPLTFSTFWTELSGKPGEMIVAARGAKAEKLFMLQYSPNI